MSTIPIANPSLEVEGVRTSTWWPHGANPTASDPSLVAEGEGVRWIDLSSGADAAALFDHLGPACPGLALEMLDDLLTPDDKPEGNSYAEGQIKLASTFGVRAHRVEDKIERGTAGRAGSLVFQPVELLSGPGWLLSCWHPTRTFADANRESEDGPAGECTDAAGFVLDAWKESAAPSAGDLGLLVMEHLALSYHSAEQELAIWHEDWELSLYVEDEEDNLQELPRLWGMMAVLRDWLVSLDRPGAAKATEMAWLPCTDLARIGELEGSVQHALDRLRVLADAMRNSFTVLHVRQGEEERERREAAQRRVEVIAAVFLVPTFVVGFYGANTWVPGQGQHWGFWVMIVALAVLTIASAGFVLALQGRNSSRAEISDPADE
jgi:hypothetical protein